jgi:FkbM family methyltransferase
LDVGANAGLLPVWLAYHDLLPDRYAGIEADPDSAGVLREQVERLPWMVPPRVIEAAAGDRHETVRFDTGGDSVFHGVSRTGGIEVPMRPLADLMDEAGLDRVDIMKLDIEGGETAVIPDAAAWADRVNVIICELHHGLDAAWLDEHLRPLGFRVFDFGVAVREGFAAVREDQLHRVPERMKQKG